MAVTLFLTVFTQPLNAMQQDSVAVVRDSSDNIIFLSLEDAVSIALEESPTVKMAGNEIVKTGYAKKGTYAALYPQIEASAAYQRTIKKQVMYMGGFDGGIEVGMNNSWNGGLSASMPLVNVALWKQLKISAMDVELAVEKARGSKIDLVEQVSNAFFAVLLAVDNNIVYKEIYDNAVVNYQNVKQKYDVGSVSEYDLIRAGVTVKNAEPALYDSENLLQVSLWQLKAVMGIDLDTEIRCKGELKDYESKMTGMIEGGTIEKNSSLAQIEIQGRQLAKNLEAIKAANYPTLGLSASYQWSSMNDSFKFSNYRWTPYSVAALSLNIPIFAGGKRRMDVKQAKIDIENLELQRTDTERSLNVELLKQQGNMQTCIRQLDAARSSISEAEKGYDIAVKRYEIGGGTLLEINDSQLALTQARLTFNQAIYNYMVAKNAIDRLTGKFETEEK